MNSTIDNMHQTGADAKSNDKVIVFKPEELKVVIDKIYNEVREAIYKESRSSSYVDWKQRFEKDHVFIQKDQGCFLRVINKDGKNEITVFKSIRELENSCLVDPRYCEWFDDLQMKHFNDWTKDANKLHYYDFNWFPTPQVAPDKILNTWSGFERSNKENIYDEKESNEVWELYNEFYDHLTSNSTELKNYLIQLDAHLIQMPGVKPGVCVVMTGTQGTGKGTRMRLLRSLIGEEYFYETSDIDQVLGRFTKPIARKLVIALDECESRKMVEKNNPLKNIITEDRHRIEGKGEPSYIENSYVRLNISSNDENVVKIEASDRRFLVVETKKIDPNLASRINFLIRDNNKCQILFQLLSKHKLVYKNMYDFQDNRPTTQAYNDIKSQMIPNYYKFFYKFINDCTQEQLNKVSNSTIKYYYQIFCENNENTQMVSDNILYKKLAKIEGVESIAVGKDRGKRINKSKALEWFRINGCVYIDHTDRFKVELQ